jgi:hypothetical protein
LGPLLLLVVLFARRGIDGLLESSAFARRSEGVSAGIRKAGGKVVRD